MNNYQPTIIKEIGIEIDDFAITNMLTRIEAGDEVDNQEFSRYVKKSFEVIRNLHQLLQWSSASKNELSLAG